MVLTSFLDAVDRLRWRHREIDDTAIEFFRAHDPEEAYQLARRLMRLARTEGDPVMERFHARVAVRISELTGRRIGRSGSGNALYGEPTRIIDGERTMRVR